MPVLTHRPRGPEHPEREDARALLDEHGYGVFEIVSVDRDSILYRDGRKQPRTAWITIDRTDQSRSIRTEPGFVAERD